jgi:nitrite reductase (NO-forming)
MLYFWLKVAGALLAVAGVIIWIFVLLKNRTVKSWLGILLALLGAVIYFFASIPYPLHFAMPPTMQAHTKDRLPASIPFKNILTFLTRYNKFEKVADIGQDPNNVPKLAQPDADGIIRFKLTAKEVVSEIDEDIYFNYWTYDGKVPGPMLRVREGDTVEITLANDPSSIHPHNIDLHAVTGPGGGATLTNVMPGETKTFRWKALASGLYEYHCAMSNVSTHNGHGQYGLILVEPKAGLPPVDKEFYVMQGELYTKGGLGAKGLAIFDAEALLLGIPTYIPFNGRIEDTPRMQAKVGDRIRIYVGNGGINLISSFHVIGEIFDTVYPEASMGKEPLKNVQTTAVLPGGAAIVEFQVEVPGQYVLVDHALARLNKGAWAILEVSGPENPEIFKAL